MRTAALFCFLAACGGSEPTPAPAPVEAPKPKPAPEPEPEPAVDFDALGDDEKKAYLLEFGQEVYETGGSGGVACVTCHMDNGEGAPGAFPPLKGAGEFYGDCEKHAGFVIKGLTGEIQVLGKTYNGVMPAQDYLSDLEIAAVISYERTSWGNDDGICMPSSVKAARAK